VTATLAREAVLFDRDGVLVNSNTGDERATSFAPTSAPLDCLCLKSGFVVGVGGRSLGGERPAVEVADLTPLRWIRGGLRVRSPNGKVTDA
jgi:hypothetical protein